jgi:two-component system cell cycle sensor histidine kinase/response regulator CckA
MATILVVDDIADNRTVLVALLRHQGHRVLEAANGSAGLAAVRIEHPDLVITDVLMPVMDGYEFVRQMRLDPIKSGIPVVFYTAHFVEHQAKAFALSSGVSFVLTKPADSAELLNVVGHLLSGDAASEGLAAASPLTTAFDHEHLRLLTDKLSETTGDLRSANERLRALIDIGLELASERDSDRLLHKVCAAARELFGATYVTLGILDQDVKIVQRFATCGTDAAKWIEAGDPVTGILETVVTGRRTLRGENPGGHPAALKLPLLHPEVRAFLAAPIVSPAHVYGWICLVGNEGRSFTVDDEDLIVALAGQVGRLYEVDHEIVERKQAESALRDERDRAQRYLDTADVILLALDRDGRITLINRKGCDLVGWTEPELIGRDFLAICLPARKRDALGEKFRRVIDGDLSVFEAPLLTRSGDERLIEWRNTLQRDDAGRVIGTFSSGADITDRSRAVEALRTAEERMRFALEAAGVGIWDMDYTTGVLRWSEILEGQYGLQPGTFGGTTDMFIERVHPEDREALIQTMARAKQAGSDFSLHHRTIWPDGTVRWLSGAGRVHLGERGQPVRAVGITMDVTDRRTLEDQYQQAQKMEAVGRLAGGVAHDFNNLLTVILGYCGLLLADFDPDDPRQTDIAEIQKAGASGAALTRQLLAFSRKEIIEPALLNLNVVVAAMREMVGRLIGEDVRVVLNLRPGLSPVMADRGQVEQIILNLAVNARDAMPDGGTLTIETANIELFDCYATTHLSLKPGLYVVLRVTDTGTGMTPQVLARLFEPFFTTKEAGKGTGLGLVTVHGIAARSGGSVEVSSEIGVGTLFQVYFPQSDAVELVAAPMPAAVLGAPAHTTVLVVEDEEGLRELARRLLQRQGCTVLVAASGAEALRLFETHPSIDLVLTDVVMPGLSGADLMQKLLEQRPALKVIYMSGYTVDAVIHHGVLKPGIAFLHKPFTSETLEQKIREVLDHPGATVLTH